MQISVKSWVGSKLGAGQLAVQSLIQTFANGIACWQRCGKVLESGHPKGLVPKPRSLTLTMLCRYSPHDYDIREIPILLIKALHDSLAAELRAMEGLLEVRLSPVVVWGFRV